MRTIKALLRIATIGIIFVYMACDAIAAPLNDKVAPLYILRVTSQQPQLVEGSYFTMNRNESELVQIHQQTPIEIKVRATVINAAFRTAAANSFFKLQLLKQEHRTSVSLLSGKGHAIIANSNAANSDASFIISR